MNVEGERDLFICHGTFTCESACKEKIILYRFKRPKSSKQPVEKGKGDRYFYVDYPGLEDRLNDKTFRREPCDQTEEALKLSS